MPYRAIYGCTVRYTVFKEGGREGKEGRISGFLPSCKVSVTDDWFEKPPPATSTISPERAGYDSQSTVGAPLALAVNRTTPMKKMENIVAVL